MGGKSKNPLKKSIVEDIAETGSTTVTGGALSVKGKGYLQNGNPLEGDTFVRGVSRVGGLNNITDPYYNRKDAGEALARKAKSESQSEQARLLAAANKRKFEEEELKNASETLAKRKSQQERRAKGKGRQSTIVTGTSDGEQSLGTISSGKALLGI
jgi:hypothetical protein